MSVKTPTSDKRRRPRPSTLNTQLTVSFECRGRSSKPLHDQGMNPNSSHSAPLRRAGLKRLFCRGLIPGHKEKEEYVPREDAGTDSNVRTHLRGSYETLARQSALWAMLKRPTRPTLELVLMAAPIWNPLRGAIQTKSDKIGPRDY